MKAVFVLMPKRDIPINVVEDVSGELLNDYTVIPIEDHFDSIEIVKQTTQ